MNKEKVELAVKELLIALGQDVNRPGLLKTPARVASAYEKLLEGYDRSFSDEVTCFDNEYGYREMVYSGRMSFYSLCEHHLLPFFGDAYVAYIPGEKIVGLSKLVRVVDIHSRRLQEQERITVEVARELQEVLGAKGVAVMLEANHMCTMSRGVNQDNVAVKTFAYTGQFDTDTDKKNDFLSLIK